MKRFGSVMRVAGAVLISVGFLVQGCSILESPTEGEAVDPPVRTTKVAHEKRQQVTLYLLDRQNRVAAFPVSISAKVKPAPFAMQALVDRSETLLSLPVPAEFRGPLPQGTQLRSLKYDDAKERITIDFSQELLLYNESSERKLLESIVWTLTELPGVEHVQLLVQGKPLRQMPHGHLPLPATLTRAFGVNIQVDGPPLQSTAVSELMADVADEGFVYLMPVTRLKSVQQP